MQCHLLIKSVWIAHQDMFSLPLDNVFVLDCVLAGKAAALASAEHRCAQQELTWSIRHRPAEA